MPKDHDIQDTRTLWQKVRDRFEEFVRRRIQNRPMFFLYAEDGEGVEVGDPVWVSHPMLHDMADHAINGVLTTLKLYDGLRFNAYRELKREYLSGSRMRRLLQPVRLEGNPEVALAA